VAVRECFKLDDWLNEDCPPCPSRHGQSEYRLYDKAAEGKRVIQVGGSIPEPDIRENYEAFVTFAACGPFCPCVISNST
jgi:hypothetical protein